MDHALMMLEAALQQLVELVVEKYDGPRDRTAIQAYAETFWREKVRPSLPDLVAQLELGEDLDAETIDSTRDGFCASIVERLRDRGPRGAHAPLTLAWTPIGPRPPSTGPVPPKAVQICDYILAYDEAARAFVYAYSHDYHQFGRAFALGEDGAFRPFSKNAFRLGDAQQYWTGTYDAHRGGVVGFSVDGDTVVGVVVREQGLTVLAPAGYFEDHHAADEPAEEERVVLGGDVPALESGDWSDLRGVFGYDRARATWVLLSEAGIWELGPDNTWTKHAELVPPAVLPQEVEGNREHSRGGAGGVWDARRRRVVFWFVDTNEKTLQLSAWDGETKKLAKLPDTGLPAELMPTFGLGCVVAEHPTHGVVIYAGPSAGLFALGDDGAWTALPAGAGGPPKSRAANLAFGPDDIAVQGPGQYALDPDADDDDGGEEQGVFFVRRGGAWTRLGSAAVKSPLEGIKSSGGWPVLAAAGGGVFATAWRRSLETITWTDEGGFREVVGEEEGEKVFGEATPKGRTRAALFEGSGKKLHALSNRGAVYRLEDGKWSVVANGVQEFGERTGFRAAYDAQADRVVVWGGEKGKGDNDTWLFANGQWHKTEASPRPRDLKYRFDEHGFDVDMLMVYDHTLGRVLRVGYDEIAVLDGDSWRVREAASLRDFVTPSNRVLAHDPQTGETLCVCPENGNVVRIDLGGCDLIGTIAAPERASDDETEPQALPFRDVVFDPATLRLLTFSAADAYGCFALDLAPAFALAKTLGSRVTDLPAAPPPVVRLYRAEKERIAAFYADAAEGAIVVRSGFLGEELSAERTPHDGDSLVELARLGAERRAAGWLTADALEPSVLAAALGRPAWAIMTDEDDDEDEDEDEDERRKRAAKSVNRLGGLPSAVAHGDWPKDESGARLGFLMQVELPRELGGGGLVVFVKTDGTATEDEENNVVLVRTKEQLGEDPPRKAPKGVPVLPPTALRIGKRTADIDPGLVDRLGAEDPLLANAIEAAQPTKVPFDKLGGQPRWLQGAASSAPLLLQYDFDSVTLEEPWEDAGLHGVLYVFKSKRGARAMWQFT